MSNMKYCMFENTVTAIQQCIEEGLDESDWDFEKLLNTSTSKNEAKAMLKFIDLCCDVAEEFGDFEYDDEYFNHSEARLMVKNKFKDVS